MSGEKVTLAQVGSVRVLAYAERGRLDICIESDLLGQPRQIGLTLMGSEITKFFGQVGFAVECTMGRIR